MAAGDIIAAIITAANTNFQPASGVEIVLFGVGSNNIASAGFNAYDGTNTSQLAIVQDVYYQGVTGPHKSEKLGITNTLYIRTNATAANYVYSGVQTK